MRVIFLGSPAEVLPVMTALQPHLVAVVSKPAKSRGRKKQLIDPAVAAYAKEHWPDLPVLQPERARDPEFLEAIAALKPDIMVTAAYGEILTEAFLGLASRAVINVHPSLLPFYRGATPVPEAILSGDTVTGVSILFTVKALDAGHLILQEPLDIGPDETADELLTRSFIHGAAMLPEALKLLEDPEFVGTPQDEDEITHCTKIHKADGELDWSQPADELYNRYRAYQPWPGVYTTGPKGKVILTEMARCSSDELLQAALDVLEEAEAAPGEFTYCKPLKALVVKTATAPLLIHRVKPEGGKDQDAAGFWNGLKSSLEAGSRYARFDMPRMRVAVAVSGTGRSLANMLERQKEPDGRYEVVGVISSHPDCKANTIARDHRLPLLQRSFAAKDQVEAGKEVSRWLKNQRVDTVFLAGFIKKFPAIDFAGTVLNIHPALLPKFGGKGMYGDRVHQEVSKSGDTETGATIHLVTANYDEGHIIAQIRIAIEPHGDADKIAAQVFAKECIIVPDTLNLLAEGKLPLAERKVWIHPDGLGGSQG